MLLSVPSDEEQLPARIAVAALGIVWPHIAYRIAARRNAGPRAERINVLLDALFGGAAAAAFSLRLWPVTAIAVIGVINALLFGGPRFLTATLAVFFTVTLAMAVALGVQVHLDTEPVPVLLSIVAIFSYVGLIGATAYRLRLRQRDTRAALEREERKSQDLLANVFPQAVIPRLRAGEAPIADHFGDVTVVFIDMVEFTPLAERLGPKRTVLLLNDLFERFDQAARQYGVEKIETTGDGYLAVGGAPAPLENHAAAVADFALAAVQAARATSAAQSEEVRIRVGIHTGPVFGGVIGESRFHYKVFGETVNTASRIQGQSQPGRILVSEETYRRIRGTRRLQEHGIVQLKGHGPMRSYWLL